ncbi:MAG: histidinol dehydrogenase [Pseudomonadota bacterium]|nr:histidinol dehydrogenase [Pseudomonadota bacterium]
MTTIAKQSNSDFDKVFSSFLAKKRDALADVDATVKPIMERVRLEGDVALVEFTRILDDYDIREEQLRVSQDEVVRSFDQSKAAEIEAIKIATNRITDFHQRQIPKDFEYTDGEGLLLGWRWTPISDVGLYVPGGLAAYPSTVLMNALPAKIAGVNRIVMTSPTPGGRTNPILLAAADIVGVDEIYRIGGAQAIAALGYGTNHIPAVDKIVGPGNVYVAAAKKLVYGVVGVDMVAGPSEVLVVADSSAKADWIAADLLAQSEHDLAAQAILFTDDQLFADKVCHSIETHLGKISRSSIAAQSWKKFGAVFIFNNINESNTYIDKIAPEHLQLATAQPRKLLAKVKNAGAIFLGRYVPEAVGDYVAGPNHVLPTDRSARYSSGLGVLDFMKRTSIIGGDKAALKAVGPTAVKLAELEGLDAHALSISIRLESDE